MNRHTKHLRPIARLGRISSRGLADIKVVYDAPEELCADIASVLCDLQRAEDKIKRLESINAGMRNALPEIMAELSNMQKKYAFTFRCDKEPD